MFLRLTLSDHASLDFLLSVLTYLIFSLDCLLI